MFTSRIYRDARTLLSTLLTLLVLISCGGGVDSGGTGSAVALGPISGFGSIIVNGVRFDDWAASIQDDDGRALTRDQLKLGMQTEIDASDFSVNAGKETAKASSIRTRSDLIGPVTGVDTSAGSLVVLGQTVVVTRATIFDARLVEGLSSIRVGATLEIHGRYDPSRARFAATRIQPKIDPLFYKLRGTVNAVDPSTKLMVVGEQTINFVRLSANDASAVAVGKLVRVTLQLNNPSGVWMAITLRDATFRLPNRDDAQIEGRISTWFSSRQFSVDGIPIDASKAQFVGGEASIVIGARVEIEGASSGGVLLARTVRLEGDEDAGNSAVELHGAIEILDTAAKTFVVRGVTVNYGGAVQFSSGSVADLAVGKAVEVQGTPSPSGDRVDATTISFEGT